MTLFLTVLLEGVHLNRFAAVSHRPHRRHTRRANASAPAVLLSNRSPRSSVRSALEAAGVEFIDAEATRGRAAALA